MLNVTAMMDQNNEIMISKLIKAHGLADASWEVCDLIVEADCNAIALSLVRAATRAGIDSDLVTEALSYR